ncbi:MAG: hypothetical protein EOP48_17435 [Sphingobacteriales bacterium]|nr:MAG: hypothetical protein EOP48_17435 [Sphingobacteriales bacterium]
MEKVTFIASCGDFDTLITATKMNHGTINLMAGNTVLCMVIKYTTGWTVRFYSDDYFKWDGPRLNKHDIGDCLMQDDKDAILDRLEEAGWLERN